MKTSLRPNSLAQSHSRRRLIPRRTATLAGISITRPWLPAALALLSFLGGCLTPPPAVVEIPAGVVRAPTDELAREVADYAIWTQAELEQRLPDLREADYDIWVQDEVDPGWLFRSWTRHAAAFGIKPPWTSTSRVHIPTEGGTGHLPHELTHVLLDPSWDTLPALLEEGLCEFMYESVTGDVEGHLKFLIAALQYGRWPDSESSPGASTDLRTLLQVNKSTDLVKHGDVYEAYAAGLASFLVHRVVERHGLPYVHDLCIQATDESLERVPVDWILQATGLKEGADLRPLITRQLESYLLKFYLQDGKLEDMLAKHAKGLGGAPWSLAGITVKYTLYIQPEWTIRRRLVDLPGFKEWRATLGRTPWPGLLLDQ